MPTPAVTADRLGAWLLKVNPTVTDLGDDPGTALAALTERCVRPGYRLRLVRPGQPVLLWVSGGSRACPPGIWATGTVTGPVVPPEPGAPTATLPIAVTALAEPILRTTLRADPRLAGLEVLRAPFGSNPSWVDRHQLAALRQTSAEIRKTAPIGLE